MIFCASRSFPLELFCHSYFNSPFYSAWTVNDRKSLPLARFVCIFNVEIENNVRLGWEHVRPFLDFQWNNYELLGRHAHTIDSNLHSIRSACCLKALFLLRDKHFLNNNNIAYTMRMLEFEYTPIFTSALVVSEKMSTHFQMLFGSILLHCRISLHPISRWIDVEQILHKLWACARALTTLLFLPE